MMRTFEPGLKDKLGCHGIVQRPGGLAVVAGFAKPGCGIERSQTLVGEADGQVEPALQALGKLPGEPGHGVRRPVGVGGQADHQLDRAPLGDEPADGGEAVIVRFGSDHRQWMRAAQQGLPVATPMRFSPKSNASTVPSGMPGDVGKLRETDAEFLHRRRQTLFRRQIEQDAASCGHRQP